MSSSIQNYMRVRRPNIINCKMTEPMQRTSTPTKNCAAFTRVSGGRSGSAPVPNKRCLNWNCFRSDGSFSMGIDVRDAHFSSVSVGWPEPLFKALELIKAFWNLTQVSSCANLLALDYQNNKSQNAQPISKIQWNQPPNYRPSRQSFKSYNQILLLLLQRL